MRDLSVKTRSYIIGVYITGFSILVWNLANFHLNDTWLFVALCVLSSLSLILKVVGSTNRSHYNISFLIYAFSFVLLRARSHHAGHAGFQPGRMGLDINIPGISRPSISLLISSPWRSLTLIYRGFYVRGEIYEVQGIVALLLAMAGYTLVNHLIIGVVIWLARGENFAQVWHIPVLPAHARFYNDVHGRWGSHFVVGQPLFGDPGSHAALSDLFYTESAGHRAPV